MDAPRSHSPDTAGWTATGSASASTAGRRLDPASLSAKAPNEPGVLGGTGPLPVRTCPLTALDEGILHLDSVSEPWSVHIEVRLAGRVDGAQLRHAVGVALGRHPRVRARLADPHRSPRGYRWELTDELDVDPVDEVFCADDDDLDTVRCELQSEPVPLALSPPLRVRLAHHPAGDVVMVNLHHAAADGMAAVRLLRSVAAAYARRPDPVPSLSADELTVPSPRGWHRARTVLEELRGAARRHTHLVPDGGEDEPGYGFRQIALSPAQTEALRGAATGGVTVNDLLLAAMHLSIDRWNARHGRPGGRTGVLMPVNLRRRRVWDEGVGNFTFMVPVATEPVQRATPEATVEAVRSRTGQVKEDRRAAAVAGVLPLLQHLPLAVRRGIAHVASREAVIPTAILSNLERLADLDFGPGLGRPVEAWFSPPAKMPLGLAVGALTTAGRLHLSIRYRRRLFGSSQADAFTHCFVSALETVVRARADGEWRIAEREAT